MIDFAGKIVLVSGGGAGIGRATAEAFARLGASVVVVEKDPALAEDVRGSLAALGAEALVIVGDVGARADVDAAAARVDAHFGRLDVLVNNVGHYLYMRVPFAEMTDEQIDALYDVNLRHIFLMTRAMLPLLRRAAPGSSIVNISSIEGFRGIPHYAVYGAFKTAVTGFTKSLGVELGPEGIRVNLVAPETTDTMQVPVDHMVPASHRHHIPQWIPLGRFGEPSDIAGCILFLASPLAAWVTGTSVHPDGGAYAAGGFYQDGEGSWTNTPVISANGAVAKDDQGDWAG